MRYVAFFAAAAMISGCASGPVEETKAFVGAVAAVKSSTDTILDDFNIAERNQYAHMHKRDPVFRVQGAYYISTIAEAPDTTNYRRALVILHDYAELLRVLVDGSNMETARGQIEALAANISVLTANPAFALAAKELSFLFDQLIAAANIAEAKRLAVAGETPIRDLVVAMKDATPSMFRVLTLDLRRSRVESTKFTEYRIALANYVVLLDRLGETFSRLIRAFERPSNPVTLAALVKATADLNADVRAMRQSLAVLRRGTP
jgi:hypothetical protein